ncbi:MAG: HEAT repeat domain-containing protein [Planctomycetota bacterium]|nr:HEAT repeat domain-containing protein [Planctomycetota bacterium]
MGFKSDREFLRNITIGAIGTRKVAEILRSGGYQIIELERYSGSNKIWATKIKRLRVPDLLCLQTGKRIESRAKTALKLTMSHSTGNPERAWDVRCTGCDSDWSASDEVNLFHVGELRRTQKLAGLSRMKSAAEGSEIQLTWPATIPTAAGTVTKVDRDFIETRLDSGRRQKYRLNRGSQEDSRLKPYVEVGDRFGGGDSVIASVFTEPVPTTVSTNGQYDFVGDLESPKIETVYAAVKALGFLPSEANRSVKRLKSIVSSHTDSRIRLEAAGALARLDVIQGWDTLTEIAEDRSIAQDLRMELSLLLPELKSANSIRILRRLAGDRENASELRAAAVWGLGAVGENLSSSHLIQFVDDSDELIAVHSIAACSRLIRDDALVPLLSQVGENDRKSAGIVRAILASNRDPTKSTLQLIETATGAQRLWLLYLLASVGRDQAETVIRETKPELLTELEFFWRLHQEYWTNRLDVADQIDFLLRQFV